MYRSCLQTVMKGSLIALFCNSLLITASDDKNDSQVNAPIELTISDFGSHINVKSHLVMFYAPWCGHCQRLHPIWDEYAADKSEDRETVGIAKVDCTVHTSLCAKHEVNGYPTIKLFKKGSETGIKFKGSRDIDSFKEFVKEELSLSKKAVEPEPASGGSGLIEHTEKSFVEKVKTGLHFIKFYAPWCGHCKSLAPAWESLGAEFQQNSAISIGKVDCTQLKTICSEYDVKGYPTLLLLSNGKIVTKYSGERSLEGLTEFVKANLGSDKVKDTDPVLPPTSVVTLNQDNFDKVISSGLTLVKFFAPWCGHCKRLAPTYEELGVKFDGKKNVKIARMDCTQDTSKDYCSKQSVQGFPSLFLYKDGAKIAEYKGDRSLENMITFLNSHESRDEL